MSEHHPEAATLSAFQRGALPAAEAGAVLAHLIRCARCAEALAPAASGKLIPLGCSGEPTQEEQEGYEAAISAAFARVSARASDLAEERRQAFFGAARVEAQETLLGLPPGLLTWALCERLLDRSFALRHENPAEMVRLARWAAAVADGLDPEKNGREALADLRARAWAELGNAYRTADELDEADAAIARAWQALPAGTGDPAIRARVAELAGSLHCHRRRTAKGFELLDAARRLYLRSGDEHGAGKVLVTKAIYTQRCGDPAAAGELLAAGMRMVDISREPKLVRDAMHNALSILIDLGHFAEARDRLPEVRWFYTRKGAGRLDHTRLLWLEGRTLLGLGEFERADAALRQVRREMDEAKLGFASALAGLDLGRVLLLQGRTAELRELIDGLTAAFTALEVPQEALAALRLLQEAARLERATLTLLDAAATALQQAEPARAR